MIIQCLTYKNLKEFIESLLISEKDKKFFLEAIPEMSLEERRELFKFLIKIYYLNQREKEALGRIKKQIKTNNKIK